MQQALKMVLPDNGTARTVEILSEDSIEVNFHPNYLEWSSDLLHRVRMYDYMDEDDDEDDESGNQNVEDELFCEEVCIAKEAILEIYKHPSVSRSGYLAVTISTASRSYSFYFKDGPEIGLCDEFVLALKKWRFNGAGYSLARTVLY